MANIQDVRSINNPQKSYQWEVSIQGLAAGALREMAFYAKTVAIPPSSIESIVIPYKSSRVSHAGRDSADHSVTLTFWDDEEQTIYGYFQNWMNLLRNPTTGGQLPKNLYAATMFVKLMDSSGDVPTAIVKLTNVFPTDLAEVSLNYDGSEPVEISLTMAYDEKLWEKA